MKIIGYCRVSTDNQKEEGTIEIQERAVEEYAKKNGFNLVDIFKDEGISGSLEDRPGLADMFNYIEDDTVEGVIVFKLDRLARDLYIQEHLIKRLEESNVKFLSIKEPDLESSDPMRKAFRQFMGIVSELEKAYITMRLSGGRIHKSKKGGYAGGGVPIGYMSKDKELIIDNDQAETVKTIFHLKRYKRMGLREIARYLNENGHRTAKGGKWYASTVKYILDNPLYKGQLSYKDNTVKRDDLVLIQTG